jgi:hypothetical protein
MTEQITRKYQGVWKKCLEKGLDKPVIVRVTSIKLMQRIKKAVWKEKNLDKENRKKYRLTVEMDNENLLVTFTLVLSTIPENL